NRPLADAWDEPVPDARVSFGPQRVGALVPTVEVPDHRDTLRIGRPDGKTGSFDTFERYGMRAQIFVDLDVDPFVGRITVVVRQQVDVVANVLGGSGRTRFGSLGRH